MVTGMDDVKVTGIGATTPLGGDAPSTWAALLAGRPGVRLLDRPGEEWADPLPVRIAAPLHTDPATVLDRVQARRLDRCEQIALIAAREAWDDAGRPDVEPERLAVCVGTGIGGVATLLAQDDILEASGPRRVSPHTIPMLMPNGAAARISMELGARAGARTTVSACAAGAEALALGLDLIRLGRADVVVAGGAEACLQALPMAAFAQARTLSTKRQDRPADAMRPFDTDRDGLVIGEGGAFFVLERAEHARTRGARAHANLVGAGITSSAHDIVASEPAGQARAIRQALQAGGLARTDIDHVHAHATATVQGDAAEAEAIADAIGTHPAVTSTKGMTGHLLGASGALGALAAIGALRDGAVPPTRNLDDPDPKIPLDLVRGAPRRSAWHAAVANCFGFGGHNVSLAFTRAV